MLFGEKRAAGIITGKSLAGYHTDEDSFDRPDQPMVRIWLDHVPEGGRPGDDKLTLEVDGDLYPRLEVARHGTAVWRGKRLLRFETEDRAEDTPEQTAPQGQGAEAASGDAAAQISQTEGGEASASMTCPWCGKPMQKKYLCSGGNGRVLALYEEAPGLLGPAGEGIVLSESTLLSGPCAEVWHCADCLRAVMDCRDGRCDYNQMRPPVSEKLKGVLNGAVGRLLQDDRNEQ